jgi:hypothetical protein
LLWDIRQSTGQPCQCSSLTWFLAWVSTRISHGKWFLLRRSMTARVSSRTRAYSFDCCFSCFTDVFCFVVSFKSLQMSGMPYLAPFLPVSCRFSLFVAAVIVKATGALNARFFFSCLFSIYSRVCINLYI